MVVFIDYPKYIASIYFSTNDKLYMTPTIVFYIIIAILLFDFIVDQVLDALNAKHFEDDLPLELQDVYDETEYERSQAYKKTRYKFGMLTSGFSLLLTLAFFFLQQLQGACCSTSSLLLVSTTRRAG